jgi:hypothetical protein
MFAWFTAAAARVSDYCGSQDFDRDRAVEPCIALAIHFARPACANGRDDFMSPETIAGRKGHHTFSRSSGL